MATVRGGSPVVETLDVGPLVRESTELFLKGTDPRGCPVSIESHCEGPTPPVRVDAGRFIQVLLALLGNAHEAIASAQRKHGRVTVRTEKATHEGRDWVTVEVADDGPGIPEEFLPRIFEPFFTTKEQGSGYGLYLASEVLKEQGGRLSACNHPKGGACFTVWLPVCPADAPAAPATSH
jgi:signal transduction histidine kinase